MANTFGDQLLKAGLVNKNQLNKAKKSKHRQKTANLPADPVGREVAASAQRAAADKAARDRELNRRQQEAQAHKAVQAQVRQLVELNRLPHDGEIGYNFQDGNAIKKLFVSQDIHDRLGRGVLAIARRDSGYAVIPAVVAEKIRLRDAACILSQAATMPVADGDDDPYADYQVPDDLMW